MVTTTATMIATQLGEPQRRHHTTAEGHHLESQPALTEAVRGPVWVWTLGGIMTHSCVSFLCLFYHLFFSFFLRLLSLGTFTLSFTYPSCPHHVLQNNLCTLLFTLFPLLSML